MCNSLITLSGARDIWTRKLVTLQFRNLTCTSFPRECSHVVFHFHEGCKDRIMARHSDLPSLASFSYTSKKGFKQGKVEVGIYLVGAS